MTSTPTAPDNPQQGPLLTLAEASAYLRCSKAHVSNLIRCLVPNSQPLPAVRLGRRVYIRRDSLARYLRVAESRYDEPAKIRRRRRVQSEERMRRKRSQRGSLQRFKQGSRYMCVVKCYDNDSRRQTTLGQVARMTKAEAQVERKRFMATINEDAAEPLARRDPSMLGEFLVGTYLPFERRRWKLSTAVTTEDRIRRHILNEIGDQPIGKLDRNALQELLDRKAGLLGSSIIEHLRFDLRAIFEMAVEDGLINRNPARSLFTARRAHQGPGRTITREEALKGLSKLDLRERLIWKLAVFGGLRPGEIFGLQRRHVCFRQLHLAHTVGC